MSNPERLLLSVAGIQEELCVTPQEDTLDKPRAVAVPRPHDVARAVAGSSDSWFLDFVIELKRLRVAVPDDPDFGVDPEDFARLLELRVAIDTHLGWSNHESEQAGDYAGRIKEVGELHTDPGCAANAARVAKLEEKLKRQRKELRRLNAAERQRSLAVSLAHHQHSVYVDPQAERQRIAHLVWSLAQLLKQSPASFTDRSLAELVESLSWRQRLVAP